MARLAANLVAFSNVSSKEEKYTCNSTRVRFQKKERVVKLALLLTTRRTVAKQDGNGHSSFEKFNLNHY